LDGLSAGRGEEGFIREEAACLGGVWLSLTRCEALRRWEGVWGWVLVNTGSTGEGQRPVGLGLAEGLCGGAGATPQLPKRSGVHARLAGGSPSQQSSSMASPWDEESGSKPTQTRTSPLPIDLPFK